MKIRKRESTPSQFSLKPSMLNIPKQRLGSGFGKSVAPTSLIKRGISSVVRAFQSLEALRSTQVDTEELKKMAAELKLTYPQYLCMLAFEHEKEQEYPSEDINVVIVRFITHLMKLKKDHADLIHDLHEVREELNYYAKPSIRKSETVEEQKMATKCLSYLLP